METKQINAKIDKELFKEFSIKCAKKDTKKTKVLVALIKAWCECK